MSFRDREVSATQNTKEWFDARCGCVTASNLTRLIEYDAESGLYIASLLKTGKKKGQRTKQAADYLTNVVAERLTGNAAENYVSFFMDRGRELEPEARRTYTLQHNEVVETVGFILHESIEWFGASPDGVIEETWEPDEQIWMPDGSSYTTEKPQGSRFVGFEVKCPSSSTHLEYLMGRCEMFEGVPAEYLPQCDAGMSCLGLDEWRFASYAPDFPKHLRLYSAVLKRNQERIDSLEDAVRVVLTEVAELAEQLAEKTTASRFCLTRSKCGAIHGV